MKRGGIEIAWTTGQGTVKKVTKFRETAPRRVVDQDLALPNLYLHFLDSRFFLERGEFNTVLRSGNDNSEIQVVLPETPFLKLNFATMGELGENLLIVSKFLRSQAEVMTGQVEGRPGGFGPKMNFRGTANASRLYYTLRTSRPKAGISLDKAAFGIPEAASLYLFAENHESVNYMTERDTSAFEFCINELPCLTGDEHQELRCFGIFLKIFYEGGFAYNEKLNQEGTAGSYLPKNVGLACLGIVPAFKGQVGIGTGYPYLVESRFLRFADTVPVTIRAISEMSPRHARYGLCFTRCVYVWETDALQREGVLNFCTITPHGGFFYLPRTLQNHWKLGGLVYAFGEAREDHEVAINVEVGGPAAAPPTGSTATAAPTQQNACVICLSEDAVMAAVPCGHRAYCPTCTAAARGQNCPVCRAAVRDVIRIY
jgi:hypothetical protein